MKSIDESGQAEKPNEDCSSHNEAGEDAHSRKRLRFFFKVGGEAEYVGCNISLERICEGKDDIFCF